MKFGRSVCLIGLLACAEQTEAVRVEAPPAVNESLMMMKDTASGQEVLMQCSQEQGTYVCTAAQDSTTLKAATSEEPVEEPLTTGEIITNVSLSVFLTLCAGMMSGLTVGLASIDRLSLEIEAKADPEVAKRAKKIFKVIDKYHWMLVTLLLCNAGCMEALPLSLDKLLPEWAAIVTSVTCVLFFGEIIPQAMCTGPSQIKIAVIMCPIVQLLMYITLPISWPIAKLLDLLMGEHELQRYNNEELRNLILLHTKQALMEMDEDHLPDDVEGLNRVQSKMIEGALQIDKMTAKEIVTDFKRVQTLPLDSILDEELLETIKKIGYSRIPLCQVASERTVIGIFLTKSLVGYTARGDSIIQAMQKKHISVRPPLYFTPSTNIAKVCSSFQKGQSHMGIVCEDSDMASYLRDASDRVLSQIQDGTYVFDNLEEMEILGVLTLENVIERIMQMDIKDEADNDRSMMYKTKIEGLQNMKTSQIDEDRTSILQGGANLLRRGKSIHYAFEDDEDPQRSPSTNQVFTSNFMLKFTAQLENNIKQYVKEDFRTSEVKRSVSSSNVKESSSLSPSRILESKLPQSHDTVTRSQESENPGGSKSASNLLRHDINQSDQLMQTSRFQQ